MNYTNRMTTAPKAATTPPAATRTQRRAAENRRAVVDAAREIIAEVGVDALKLEAVAERADVAVQTIYNRVGGRSAVLTAVAEQALEESRVYMDAAYETPGRPDERILAVATTYARFARERPHEFRILVEPPDEPEALARIAELTRHQNAKLATALREAMDQGIARLDLDPDAVATAAWAAMNGILALAWRPGGLRVDGPDLDRLIAAHIGALTDGIRRPASTA